jgi:hypothetical protein
MCWFPVINYFTPAGGGKVINGWCASDLLAALAALAALAPLLGQTERIRAPLQSAPGRLANAANNISTTLQSPAEGLAQHTHERGHVSNRGCEFLRPCKGAILIPGQGVSHDQDCNIPIP